MEAKDMIFQLSDLDEQIVRTYRCIKLKRWFAPSTVGYLTVTNRRIIFHSSGKSLTGKSLLINEMPLHDVAGLSVYEGLSFNWLMFLLFTGVAYFATQLLVSLLPSFLISYWFALLLMLPYVIIWLFSSNILSDQLKSQVNEFFDNLLPAQEEERDLRTYLPILRLPLYFGLAILGWRLAFTSNFGLGTPLVAWGILLAAYGFIFMDIAGRRHSFTLEIGSKTKKDSGIYIPGDSLNLIPGREMTALQGVGSSPAEDASQVMRELGALLLDIEQLGELAIEKWQQ